MHAILQKMSTPLQIRKMPDDAMKSLRERATRRRLSLAAYARKILVREASRATMEETLAAPRAIKGSHLTAGQLKRLTSNGRS